MSRFRELSKSHCRGDSVVLAGLEFRIADVEAIGPAIWPGTS